MKITRHNYEAVFIDYIDGKLSAAEEAELRVFLEQNSDLAQELDSIRGVMLEAEPKEYAFKENLKKIDHIEIGIDKRFEYLCIADFEGDISKSEREELKSQLQSNPNKISSHLLYQKLKLEPDKSQIFSYKSSIKRVGITNISVRTFIRATSIAASLGLLFGIVTLFRLEPMVELTQVAIVETNPIDQLSQETIAESLDQTSEQTAVNVSPKSGFDVSPRDVKPTYEEIVQELVDYELERVSLSPIEPISTQRLMVENYLASTNPSIHGISSYSKSVDETNAPHEHQVLYAGTSRTIGMFEIAQFGLQRLSNFTGASINLDGEKDNDGSLTKVRFETNLFALSVPVKRK